MPRAHLDRRRILTALWVVVMLLSGPADVVSVRAQTPTSPSVETALESDDLAIGCGPRLALAPPATSLQLIGSQQGLSRLYGPGDGLVVTGGATQGLREGQWYYVRRPVSRRWQGPINGRPAIPVHTAGWIRITAVQQETAIAEVVHSCDGFMQGDYLEAFTAPQAPTVVLGTPEPDFGQTASVLYGDEGKGAAGPGEFMLIDKGAAAGVSFGQRVTVFRDQFGGHGPVNEVAAAIVVEVTPEISMIRIDSARQEVYPGDSVALHPIK